MPRINKKGLQPNGPKRRFRKRLEWNADGSASEHALKGHFSEAGLKRGEHAETAGKEVYNKANWKSLRSAVLQEEPLCQACLYRGRVEPASQVDHIVPISVEPELSWSIENLWGLCASCHSRKTLMEKGSIPSQPTTEARLWWCNKLKN